MEHSSCASGGSKSDKTTPSRVELIDKRFIFGLLTTINEQSLTRGSFYTKNQVNMTSRREDIRDMVIKIWCKGTTLRSINTIQSYMTLLMVVLDSTNHYNITTTYYWMGNERIPSFVGQDTLVQRWMVSSDTLIM